MMEKEIMNIKLKHGMKALPEQDSLTFSNS